MPQEQLFNKIFGRTENAADSKDFLKNTVDKYPYFSIAQYYLLKSTAPSDADHKETLARTSLFFEPFSLNALLSEPKSTSVILPVSQYTITSPVPEIKKEEPMEVKPEEPQIEVLHHEKPKIEVLHHAEPQHEIPKPIVLPIEEPKIQASEKEPEKEELLFEPLHATDYFASQGIKLSEAVLESDKLGKQLKSFTAWLKTMKRVHPEKSGGADTAVDTAVRTLAEKSNNEEDIITEAMAEAFVQQGKSQKAIDLYTKLSLLDPLKSAYFAAKIDHLKT